MSATRRPARPGVARPVTERSRGTAAPAAIRRAARSVVPRAGQRRRAAALVLSPLARQVAALGLALCAVALSLAYPLRGYLEQQAAERAAVAQQHQLEQRISDLKAQQAALSDPVYIKAEAKRRLQYVSPGDTVYVVKVPEGAAAASGPPAAAGVTPQAATGSSGPTGSSGSSGAPDAGTVGAPGSAQGSAQDSAQVPAGNAAPGGSGASGAGQPWYASLWDTLAGDGGAAVAPPR